MSYCVQCGVELASYNKKCPLCKTPVVNPNSKATKINTDYPDYSNRPKDETKKIKHYVTGIILSIQVFVYSLLTFFIDWLTSDTIYWSLFPILSLTLIWFTVAYPFFRKRNTFFRLFTFDCIAVLIFLLALNFVISNNFMWAKYSTVSIVLLWIIIAGIFLTDRIRKVVPVTIFYILSFVIISTVIILFIDNGVSILHIAVPIIITFMIVALVSYFIIKSSSIGVPIYLMVLFVDVSILSIVIDLTVHNYLYSALVLSWSIIVNAVTIPLASTVFAINKSSELNLLIRKNFHR